jgi:hypothetical protein
LMQFSITFGNNIALHLSALLSLDLITLSVYIRAG